MTALTARAGARTRTRTRRRGAPRRGGGFALGVLEWAIGLLFVAPVLWMLLTSLHSEGDAATNPPSLAAHLTFNGYKEFFDSNPWPALINSAAAALVSTLLVLCLATPAAYALSIARVPKWRDGLFFFMSTRMMPAVASILPLYIIAKNLKLLDNIWLLVLIYTAMNLPIAVWMIRSFLVELPKEVLEAARVDGAKLLTEMRRIILPMIAPGLAATALICFIFAWNEFFFAVSLTATKAATVPVFLVGFITSEGLFWARLSAASTMAVLPVIIAGWIAQKWLVRGLSLGAVK
jgi:sorbitol/mannitol transport system permease protein